MNRSLVLRPKSPMFTPLRMSSLAPPLSASCASLTTDAMDGLRLLPRANGIVQYEQK